MWQLPACEGCDTEPFTWYKRKPYIRVKTLSLIQRARPRAGCSPHRGWPGQKREEARGLRSQPGLYTGRIQGWTSVSQPPQQLHQRQRAHYVHDRVQGPSLSLRRDHLVSQRPRVPTAKCLPACQAALVSL